jgi:hypothetical protein
MATSTAGSDPLQCWPAADATTREHLASRTGVIRALERVMQKNYPPEKKSPQIIPDRQLHGDKVSGREGEEAPGRQGGRPQGHTLSMVSSATVSQPGATRAEPGVCLPCVHGWGQLSWAQCGQKMVSTLNVHGWTVPLEFRILCPAPPLA